MRQRTTQWAPAEKLSKWTAVSCLLIGLATSGGCGGATDVEQPTAAPANQVETTGRGFASPEDCFAAMREAAAAKDYDQLLACLTTESHDVLATALFMAGSVSKAMAGFAAAGGDLAEPMQKSLAAIDEVMAQHGVAGDVLDQAAGGAMMAQGPDQLLAMTAPIADKRAFVLDMMVAMESLSSMPGASRPEITQVAGELTNVSIDGDRATAVVEQADGASEAVEFHNSEEGWKLHFDLDRLMNGGGP